MAQPREHVRFVCMDPDHGPGCDTPPICALCMQGNGELTTHCPGVPLSFERRALVRAGQSDFRLGRWRQNCASPNGSF
jgi:hypothetical protein